MSTLRFCAHCGLAIYTHEKNCPHCHIKEPTIGSQASKAIALSFLMGLTVSCNPKPQPPENLEIPAEQPTDNADENASVDGIPDGEDLFSEEAEQEPVEAFNEELILEKPEQSLQMKYGIPDMPRELIQPWLQISSVGLDAKYAHHEQVLKQEIQKFLNSCDASIFPNGDTMNIEISLRSGIVTKPLLQPQGLTASQEKCIRDALWKKRLNVPMSGTIRLTLQQQR